jgi:hypothetical protein
MLSPYWSHAFQSISAFQYRHITTIPAFINSKYLSAIKEGSSVYLVVSGLLVMFFGDSIHYPFNHLRTLYAPPDCISRHANAAFFMEKI